MSDETPQAPQQPETSDTPTESFHPVAAPTAAAPTVTEHKTSKLNKALAWVGIIAGSVFIVATIFFSGFIIGAHCGGGHHGWHKHHGDGTSQYRDGHDGPHMGWHPSWGGPGGPGFQGPGGPGFQGPGGPGFQGPGGPGFQGPGGPGGQGPAQPGH